MLLASRGLILKNLKRGLGNDTENRRRGVLVIEFINAVDEVPSMSLHRTLGVLSFIVV